MRHPRKRIVEGRRRDFAMKKVCPLYPGPAILTAAMPKIKVAKRSLTTPITVGDKGKVSGSAGFPKAGSVAILSTDSMLGSHRIDRKKTAKSTTTEWRGGGAEARWTAGFMVNVFPSLWPPQ
eukprot:scaffold255206_cov50-Attheya_sp.AAC.3